MPRENSPADPLPEPRVASNSSFVTMLRSLVSAALWLVLIWAVYFKLPDFQRLAEDFDMDVGQVTLLVLAYSWIVLPLVAVAAGASLTIKNDRWPPEVVLFGLPLVLLTGLAVTVGLPILKLLHNLS